MAFSNQELSLFDPNLSDIVEGLSPEDGVSLFPELEDTEPVNNITRRSAGIIKGKTATIVLKNATGQQLGSYLGSVKSSSVSATRQWVESQKHMTSLDNRVSLRPSPSDSGDTHSDYEDFDPETIASGLEQCLSNDGRLSMSKNAVSARENRQKKKKFINGLEKSVKELSGENQHLKCKVNKLQNRVQTLDEEVKYLKSVITNQSTLSKLLKNIKSTPDVQFSSSLLSRPGDDEASDGVTPTKSSVKRRVVSYDRVQVAPEKENEPGDNSSDEEGFKKQRLDHDYASSGSILPREDSTAGVCLHVSNRSVSLEFCAMCNSKASSGPASRRKTTHPRRTANYK